MDMKDSLNTSSEFQVNCKITYINYRKHYGFISSDKASKIFFHFSKIVNLSYSSPPWRLPHIEVGDLVEAKVIQYNNGDCEAFNVYLLRREGKYSDVEIGHIYQAIIIDQTKNSLVVDLKIEDAISIIYVGVTKLGEALLEEYKIGRHIKVVVLDKGKKNKKMIYLGFAVDNELTYKWSCHMLDECRSYEGCDYIQHSKVVSICSVPYYRIRFYLDEYITSISLADLKSQVLHLSHSKLEILKSRLPFLKRIIVCIYDVMLRGR